MATGKESEPDYALNETKDKSIFYYYDNIDDEVTPEVSPAILSSLIKPFGSASHCLHLLQRYC